MQTTKWGPPGWRLLHSISSIYPTDPNPQDRYIYQFFFTQISNVLPCIYCRQSYRQFIAELPIQPWLDSRQSLMYYLYLIHNKVNDKLRQQGYLNSPNPPFKEVLGMYDREKTYQDSGWDFLYAIAFNYPVNPHESDKYNYKIFFQQLKRLLPYEPVRSSYATYINSHPIEDALSGRDDLIEWFYAAHHAVAKDLGFSKFPNYDEICQKYEDFRAACNLSKANTCRTAVKHTLSATIVD